jgi:hypothetical protein
MHRRIEIEERTPETEGEETPNSKPEADEAGSVSAAEQGTRDGRERRGERRPHRTKDL